MKTPREVILERHYLAEAKLKTIRAEDLAACARSAAAPDGQPRSMFSLAALTQRFYEETLWPWRRIWGGVAAGWIVVVALSLATHDTPGTDPAGSRPSNPEVLAVLQQQEQLLSQLLDRETQPHRSRSHPPGPRSAAQPSDRGSQEASWRQAARCADVV